MKLVTANVELMEKKEEELDIQFLERVGRTCYKSEDKITEDGESARKLVGGMFVGHGHEAMLEHLAYVFEMDEITFDELSGLLNDLRYKYGYTVYINTTSYTGRFLASGNIRAWRDLIRYGSARKVFIPFPIYKGLINDSVDSTILFSDLFSEEQWRWMNSTECQLPMTKIDQSELSEEEAQHHYYQTVRFTCDRGVTHEIVRHRPASYAQESTRYCNYSLGKFDGECSFVNVSKGIELDKKMASLSDEDKEIIKKIVENVNMYAEDAYQRILNLGGTPQIARDVLPGGLKTELVMTSNLREWNHFLTLRASSAAHPQMREVAYQVAEQFLEKFNWADVADVETK